MKKIFKDPHAYTQGISIYIKKKIQSFLFFNLKNNII